MFHFYILHCNDGTLYCGSTKNLESRETAHNLGKGSKYVLSHGGGTIVYSEQYPTWGEALSREAAVKKWSRKKKLELCAKNQASL